MDACTGRIGQQQNGILLAVVAYCVRSTGRHEGGIANRKTIRVPTDTARRAPLDQHDHFVAVLVAMRWRRGVCAIRAPLTPAPATRRSSTSQSIDPALHDACNAVHSIGCMQGRGHRGSVTG
jgi:hypothetical protein